MNKKLNRELAKEYYKLAPKASGAIYGLLAITLYFYWGEIPNYILFSWVSVNIIFATAFLLACRLYKRMGSDENAATWLRIYALLVLLQDVPFGLIAPISFMVDNDVYQMFTLFMLGGMVAGGMITRGMVFRIYVVQILSLLVPLTITLALEGTAIANGMLALVLIFMVFMISVAKNYSATITRNILLWLDNEKLVDQLSQSYSEVEKANHELIHEIEFRKKIEGELIEAKDRSELANEAKNQFLANVSHELRTPLNGIVGFSDLLKGEMLGNRVASYASQISRSAAGLLHIVNDILDITAIEAGYVAFRKDSFSLHNELLEVMNILRPVAERKKLMLEMDIDADVADNLYGDANRLRQIMSNLIANAVKYTEKGEIDVHIRLQDEQDGQVIIRFEIKDTGIGIPESEQDTIFDNFTRVEGFEARRSEGIGLGLAIVKNLVQCMGGTISVESKPGYGSCFSFELPFVHSTETTQIPARSEQSCVIPLQWSKPKTLIVDDNEINRRVMSAFLDKAGIPYTVVDNGLEAIECIRSDCYDVVLLDIQMPGVSGLDVIDQIQKEALQLPVMVAVTAHASAEQEQRMLSAGFSYFLAKPVFEKQLMKVLTGIRLDDSENRNESHNVA